MRQPRLDRGTCRVTTGPVYSIEVQTVMSISQQTLGVRRMDAQFRRSGDKIEIILR